MASVRGNALKEISRFMGSEDVERWIRRFEMAIRIDRLQEEEADALALKLDGPAYDTWAGLSPLAQAEAEEIKAALRKAYGKSRTDAWMGLMSCSLLPDEPVDACAERIKKDVAVALAGSDPKDSVGALVLMGLLPPEVRDKVALHLNDNLTVEQVVSTTKVVMSERTRTHAAAVAAAKVEGDCRVRTGCGCSSMVTQRPQTKVGNSSQVVQHGIYCRCAAATTRAGVRLRCFSTHTVVRYFCDWSLQ